MPKSAATALYYGPEKLKILVLHAVQSFTWGLKVMEVTPAYRGLCLTGNVRINSIWLESEKNPADTPATKFKIHTA